MINDKRVFLIPNTITPYGYELIHILAYPNGFRYRFRFDQEWVSEEAKITLSSLINKRAVIIFRDMKKAKFYPIRYAKIINARKIADIFYFEYLLEEIIDFDSNEAVRNKQLEDFNKDFTEYHPFFTDNNPEEDMKPLVFLSNFEIRLKNDNFAAGSPVEKDSERFGNVIENIKNIEFYDGISFIKIIDINNINQKGTSRQANVKKRSFQLKLNTDYSLRLLQLIPKYTGILRKTPNEIRISSDNNHIAVTRGEQIAVGKYDVLTFYFRTNAFRSGWSYLDICHIPKENEIQAIDSRLNLPVLIEKDITGIFKYAFIILASSIFYFFPDLVQFALPKVIFNFIKSDSIDKLLQAIGLFGLVVSFIDLRNKLSISHFARNEPK